MYVRVREDSRQGQGSYIFSPHFGSYLGELGQPQRLAACPWWMPQDRSADYFSYAQPQTWGRARLLINGRSSGGTGPNDDRSEPFDMMQYNVETTNPGDAVYLASWMFDPKTKLTRKSKTAKTWGDLIAAKAGIGVTFRLLLNDFPPMIKWGSNLKQLDALILNLPPLRRDHLKYVLSRHPAHISLSSTEAAFLSKLSGLAVHAGDQHVAVHHQKFMVVRHGDRLTAFCGGVDIIPGMTPAKWSTTPWHGWHDLQVQLDGPITRDLEKEFVARWNRERGASRHRPLPGWSPLERLALTPPSTAEQIPGIYRTAMQMLRTVSESTGNTVGAFATTRRDDVRQAYQHGIACAEQFLYMENQYFRSPEFADWIVARGAERPSLIVIIVVVHGALAEADDGKSALTDHGFFLQFQTFDRIVKGLGVDRVRFYEMHKRYVHSKLIFADDLWCCIGSANVNPRGFGLDSELNVQLREPNPEVLTEFRKRLWAHNLGVSEAEVGAWSVSDFIARWDKVAAANARKARDSMAGEGILRFDYKKFPGKKLPVDVGLLANLGIQGGGSRTDRLA
jgi:phosphatidylserine/phosphatidylglycerophosphate/cardiolipin synthase-like enzyme